MSADREVIDIRPEERLDVERLEPFLRAHLPGAQGPLGIRQFGGGHANLTYLVRFGSREFVLRRPPLGPLAPSAHDMQREHRVLSVLHRAYALAPRSLLLCTDPAIIGADFVIEERRFGSVIRSELPAILASDARRAERLGYAVIDALADLHQVDAEAVGLGDFGRPPGYLDRQVDGWIGRWHAAKDRELPAAGPVIAWIDKERPPSRAVAIVHNDYKLDNLLLDAGDPTRIEAVLDWDMCTRGDPLMDLGYLLNFWAQASDDAAWIEAAPSPTLHPGFPTRREIIERYAARTGFALDAITWHAVFGVFRLIVIIQQIFIRYLRGQTHDERFAVFGKRVELLYAKSQALIAGG